MRQVIRLTFVTMAALLCSSFPARAQDATVAPENKPQESKPNSDAKPGADAKPNVKVVQAKDFCARLTNAMTTLGNQLSSDRREAVRIGGKASAAIISQLKKGSMMPYMDTQTFTASKIAENDKKWFSLSEVLLSSLGTLPKNVLLVDNLNDLNLTSQAMPGSQFLVLAKSIGDMTPERAKTIAQTAQALGIQINIIWVNTSRDGKDIRAAQGLAFMSALTGGSFLDLSLDGACGQT